MPQFWSLFYAILQSWRPNGGGHGPMAPPKYAPELSNKLAPGPKSEHSKRLTMYYRLSNYS